MFIAVVGLGYVGLPLAVGLASSRKHSVVGFDLDERKIEAYQRFEDPHGDLTYEQMMAARDRIIYSSDEADLVGAEVIIVAVPTPITEEKTPDLTPLIGATRTVGRNLSPGTIVVYESTVYPGCTEEVCVPILEEESGLKWNSPGEINIGFYVGYSPERINPGDKVHRLDNITKIVSGDTPLTLDIVAEVYESVVKVGVHRASSIKVAEAAKVIENTQRDLNIALVNELSIIFHRLGIDTLEVLEAAGTKWNFLPFRPGLVGGHCIGVDPYYLTSKAQAIGYNPQVILAGRRTNDGMGTYIAEQTVKQMIGKGSPVRDTDVTVLGITFKENCPDIRNSRVIDIIDELKSYHCNVHVCDPNADKDEVYAEYGIELEEFDRLPPADAVIIAVGHEQFINMTPLMLGCLTKSDGVIIDVKSVLDRQRFGEFDIWRL